MCLSSFSTEPVTRNKTLFVFFSQAELSVTVDQDPSTGRVEVTGVGPVTDPSSNYPMAFTLIQTHTFWLELMVKNSIRLLL